jgi:hypothetical protein
MSDRALMQQALDALEWHENAWSAYRYAPAEISQTTITALRERLAQPEQEPVAWGVFDGPNLHDMFFTKEDAQEMVRLKGDGSTVKPLYTAPPQRKPLTDEQIDELSRTMVKGSKSVNWLCRAIEVAHGIKEST